jgi:hypothetical protein
MDGEPKKVVTTIVEMDGTRTTTVEVFEPDRDAGMASSGWRRVGSAEVTREKM